MDIAIVANGFVLPKTKDINQFWDNLLRGHSLARPLPPERADITNINKMSHEKISTHLGVFIEEEVYKNLSRKYKVSNAEISKAKLLLLESLSQIKAKTNFSGKTAIIIGNMYGDERSYEIEFNRQVQGLNTPISNSLYHTLNNVMKTLGIHGESAFVDAACASSHCAINIACKKLLTGEVDYAIAGGLEANLMAATYMIFSFVNGLSHDQCRPFDKDHNGIIQGEGVVLFALQRLDDAIKEKKEVLGIIKSIGISSDGKTASLFAPSFNGQMLSYERCYKDSNNKRLDYIEAHGTGTIVGDNTEIETLGEFFSDFKIPVGSIKSVYGNTLACAGALGLLKAIEIIKRKEIPGSPYFKKFPFALKSSIYVNKKNIKIKKRNAPLKIGINSFGFGGANYHISLEEDMGNIMPFKKLNFEGTVINAFSSCHVQEISKKELEYFNIPPNSYKSIDRIQIVSLMTVFRCLKKLNYHIQKLHPDDISVISTIDNNLDKFKEIELRARVLSFLGKGGESKAMLDILDKYSRGNEDSSAGTLKNVVAGRVTNFFNYRGFNFNVDAQENSFHFALNFLKNEFSSDQFKIAFIVGKTSPDSLFCWCVSSESYSKKMKLPVDKVIKKIQYDRTI